MDIYQELARIKSAGEEAALVTVVSASGSTPREQGAKMLVRPDGSIMGTVGGGSVEARAIKEALEAIKRGRPQRFEFKLKAGGELGMICGGDVELFIEPILAEPMLYIFGGGHIGLVLAQMGSMLGFRIGVIDDREEFANAERFPEAELTLAGDYKQAFGKLNVDKASYLVIVTHGHAGDEAVLERALTTDAKYIGMIGSRTKIKTVYSHLKEKGISETLLDRVHAPVGLAIGAQTPEEIAVSIFAEIIKIKRMPEKK